MSCGHLIRNGLFCVCSGDDVDDEYIYILSKCKNNWPLSWKQSFISFWV